MLPDRMEWRAQHVQMIAFPTEPQLAGDKNWWSQLTGSEPDESVRKSQKRVDSGIFENVALTLEIDPFRVIWTASPQVASDNPPEDIPNLGSVFDRRDWMIGLMSQWLEDSPPIKRLAFAGKLLQFVDSRDEAYRRMNGYLPGVEVDPDTTDFMYRVNRPRDSQTGIAGLRINRLCTWSAVKFNLLAL